MEGIIVIMVALAISGMGLTGFLGWRLYRLIETETDALHASSSDQTGKLASVSSELYCARAELVRVHSEVSLLRAELDAFVHGPPSIRSGPRPNAHETNDRKR